MHTSAHARLTRFAAVLVLLVLAVPARAEAPLRWKFKQGETLNYVLERGVEGKMNLTGSEITFKMGMAFDIAWTAKSVESDGTAAVDLSVDRIQINMASPLGGNLAFDSAGSEKAGGPVFAQMEPMITGMLGQTFKVKISPLGKVTDIELPQKLADVFAKQAQGTNRQQGFGIGGNAFSEKGLKELIEKSVLPLPEAAPGKDVSWEQHFENLMRGIGTQMTDIKYSFAGNEKADGRELAKIESVTELTFEPADNPMADCEITSQEGTATFLFDPQAGRMIKATGVQKFVMDISGAREVTQDMKETMSMRLGKSPEAKPADKAAK